MGGGGVLRLREEIISGQPMPWSQTVLKFCLGQFPLVKGLRFRVSGLEFRVS